MKKLDVSIPPEMWVSIFLVLGVIIRTLLPWLKKKADDPSVAFDPKFVYTAILGLISTYVELAAVLAEAPYALAALPTRLAILMGFFFGMGNNELWNRILHQGTPAESKPTPT